MDKFEFGNRAKNFFAGRGFYVVLFLCVAVIGVSAWVLMATDTADNADIQAVNGTAESDKAGTFDSYDNKSENVVSEMAADTEQDNAEVWDDSAEQNSEEEVDDTAEMQESELETVSGTLTYVWPLSGNVVNEFSMEQLLYNKTMADWRTHNGVDLEAQLGAKVMAVADGTVSEVYDDDLLGTTVIIDHGSGLCSVYSNLAGTPTVTSGDTVSMGDVIGSVGSTAIAESAEVSHLHFSVTLDGSPVDPAEYLPDR